jgi:hypothetical protein
MFVIFAAMTQFSVPFAVPSMQVVIGIPLAIAFIGGTRWGPKHLVTCIQIARGAKPRPPKIPSQSYVLAGTLIFAALTAFSLWCGFFLLALLTTRPTLVTEQGITAGGGPPYYQQRVIRWSSVVRVNCLLSRSGGIAELDVYSSEEEKIGMRNAGVRLEDVRDFIAQHVPASTLRPCVNNIRNDD